MVLPTPGKHRPSRTSLTSRHRSLCPQELGWGQGEADGGGESGSQSSCQMTPLLGSHLGKAKLQNQGVPFVQEVRDSQGAQASPCRPAKQRQGVSWGKRAETLFKWKV